MRRVPNAMFLPGHCAVCSATQGEMIDIGVESFGHRIYLCVQWCAPRLAALLDEAEPERRCSATKANGQPCTAKALPGRDLCVAHTRVQQKEEADALAHV
jgi:hypothetical protein